MSLGALAAGFGLAGASAFAQVEPAPASPASAPAPASPASTPLVPASLAPAPPAATTLGTIAVKARAETDENSLRATTSGIGRVDQDLHDIPQGVTVLTDKLLEERRADTVKDALHYSGGISFQAAEGGEEDVRLRGFSLTASGDIYVDSIRDPAFYDRDIFAFDRIELLRGSASMLFGRGSTGGVVNQVSKRPLLADVSEVRATAGSGAYARFTGDFNLKLSDTSALRLNAVATSAENHGNAIDKQGIAPTLRWGIGSADEFMVGLFYLRNDNGINYGVPWLRSRSPGPFSDANPAALLPVNPSYNYAAASDYSRGEAAYGTLDHVHRFGNGGVWHTVLRQGWYDRDQRASAIRFCARTSNAAGVVANADCPLEAPTLATIDGSTPLLRGTNNKVQSLRNTYLQTDYSKTFEWLGRRHAVLGGIDLAREAFDNFTLAVPAGVTLDKNTPRATVGAPDDGTSVDETQRQKVLNRNFIARAVGIYAQDLIEVAPHWKVLAGLRWDRFEGDYTSPATVAADATVSPEIRRSRADSLWSQRFGVIWQPSEKASVYASYGTSFNTSGELYNYDAQGSNTPPEKSRNVEVGSKLDLFAGNLSTRVAVFRTTKYNERNRDSPSGVPLDDYLLSGERHATGVELDVAGRLTPAWEVFVSYAWIPSARIDKVQGTTLTGELEGQRPSLTPRHSGSLFTTYQATDALRLGGGLNARSPQTPNRNPAGIVARGFVTYDIFGEYAFSDTLALKLNVVNVTNKFYADSLYTAHYIAGQPRTVYATLTARF